MGIPAIPPGPAWAVAMGMVFAGLALLLKAGVPLIQAVRRTIPPDAAAERYYGRC